MKKAGSGGAAAAAPKNVDEYLAGLPEPARTTLSKVRAAIRKAAPAEATEAVGYGMPMFRYEGALLAYGAFKKHCSFFPMSLGVMAELKQELAPYEVAKGTIHFPLDKPLPAALVKKLVKARVAEKARKKKR